MTDPESHAEASGTARCGSENPNVAIVDGDFVVDAALVAALFDLPASDVSALMRKRSITSLCETGIDLDQGTFRLNMFHGTRHARIRIDAAGHILKLSVIDFGKPGARKAPRPVANPRHE